MLYILFLLLASCSSNSHPSITKEDQEQVVPVLVQGESSVAPINRDNCPADYPIKGNIRIEKIFHVPGGRYYNITDPEECFANSSAAINAGYRPSKR